MNKSAISMINNSALLSLLINLNKSIKLIKKLDAKGNKN